MKFSNICCFRAALVATQVLGSFPTEAFNTRWVALQNSMGRSQALRSSWHVAGVRLPLLQILYVYCVTGLRKFCLSKSNIESCQRACFGQPSRACIAAPRQQFVATTTAAFLWLRTGSNNRHLSCSGMAKPGRFTWLPNLHQLLCVRILMTGFNKELSPAKSAEPVSRAL